MRVSNNNQTTFGMNPKFIPDKANPELAKRVNRVRAKILKVGNPQTVCEFKNTPGGDVFVGANLKAPDGEDYRAGVFGSPDESLVMLTRLANAQLTQHIANQFAGGFIK